MNCGEATTGTLLPLRNGWPIFFTKQSLIGRLTRECVSIDAHHPNCPGPKTFA